MRKSIRNHLPAVLSRLPDFRGRGRLTLFLDKFLTRENDHDAVGLVNGFPFELDLRPWGQKFAFYYREWERDLIATFRDLYRERGGDFLDVGSSLGLYVVGLGDLVRRAGARIRAIEPLPRNRERQARNIALNALQDIVDVYPVALGAERIDVLISVDGNDSNGIISSEGTIRCEVVPLDELARDWPRIGAMKIDVEGYEPKVIEGGKATIARDLPIILAEFNRERMTINQFDIEPSWTFLHGLGYRAFRLEGGQLVALAKPGAFENLFFLPPDASRKIGGDPSPSSRVRMTSPDAVAFEEPRENPRSGEGLA
ncbi:MAG: FkbM family methyltransferase [Acidobacteria bacterium]|nr:FkbM family methyltransferase [Acidobacteriota bacterium]